MKFKVNIIALPQYSQFIIWHVISPEVAVQFVDQRVHHLCGGSHITRSIKEFLNNLRPFLW